MTQDYLHYLGCSTFLVYLDQLHFLVDASFSKKILGFSRREPFGLNPFEIPPITALMVTHADCEHLDLFSYKYFSQDTPIIVPSSYEKMIQHFLHNPIVTLSHWESTQIQSVTISSVPTSCAKRRWPQCSLFPGQGLLIKGSKHSLYFSGDTATNHLFDKIKQEYAPDIAIMSVGFDSEQPIKKNPCGFMVSQCIEALQMLGSKKGILLSRPHAWIPFKRDKKAKEILSQKASHTPLGIQVMIPQSGEKILID